MTNQNGVFEDKLVYTLNGYGANMNLVVEATKVIMNSKLEMKLG